MEKLKLKQGCSLIGAQMGRRNELPDDVSAPIKLQMERLRWIDGDYDHGGAYWGRNGVERSRRRRRQLSFAPLGIELPTKIEDAPPNVVRKIWAKN